MSKPTFYDQQDKGLHHEHKTNGSVGLAAALWIRRSLHAGVGAVTDQVVLGDLVKLFQG